MQKAIKVKASIKGGKIEVPASIGATVVRVVGPPTYRGVTEVTPSDAEQTLPTKDKLVRDDIMVHPAPVEGLLATLNGQFTPSSGKVGFSAVTVDVNPDLRPLSVSENGSYQPDGFDGYSDVTVDVEPNLTSLSVTENGLYLPESGVDGFDRVSVDVPQPSGSTTITENGTYDVEQYASAVVDVYPTEYSDNIDNFSGGNIRALISHANEYIDTGYYPMNDVEIRAKTSPNQYSNQYGGLFCAGFSDLRIGCQYRSTTYTQVIPLSTLTQNTNLEINVPNEDTPYWIRAGYTYQSSEQALRPLIIFYVYRGTGYDRKAGMNFYGLKCYENKKLVKKYVPWLDENNVPCVHELIDDEYFYNVGTGTFGYIDLEGNEH